MYSANSPSSRPKRELDRRVGVFALQWVGESAAAGSMVERMRRCCSDTAAHHSFFINQAGEV